MFVPDVITVWVIYGAAQGHFILITCCMSPYCHVYVCKISLSLVISAGGKLQSSIVVDQDIIFIKTLLIL